VEEGGGWGMDGGSRLMEESNRTDNKNGTTRLYSWIERGKRGRVGGEKGKGILGILSQSCGSRKEELRAEYLFRGREPRGSSNPILGPSNKPRVVPTKDSYLGHREG